MGRCAVAAVPGGEEEGAIGVVRTTAEAEVAPAVAPVAATPAAVGLAWAGTRGAPVSLLSRDAAKPLPAGTQHPQHHGI